MPTYPLDTLAPTVSVTGISAPSYNDVYQSLIASFKAIYGASIYVAPDSQDGQWLAILARAIYDSNQTAVSVFQAFSPTYSQGVGLSSLVKLNGLNRKIPTHSSASGVATGQAGTVISNGVVQDVTGNQWLLPASVVIPLSGEVAVTITASQSGSVLAPLGTINTIYNPQLGWQAFVNTADAIVGNPVETDAGLRLRQFASVATPALGIKEAIYAAVANIPGVGECTVYENDTGSTDHDGVPAHSVAVVVSGGDTNAIALAIASRKPTGAQTFGTTTVTVYDQYGLPTTIHYFTLTFVPVFFAVTLKARPGYVSTTGTEVKQALSDFINSLTIGESVYLSQASAAAAMINTQNGQSFYITAFTLGLVSSPNLADNVQILFNQRATCTPDNILIVVV